MKKMQMQNTSGIAGRAMRRWLAAGLALAFAGAASAADITWTGSGADKKWSTGANWNNTSGWPLNPSVHRLIFVNNDLNDTVAKRLADIPAWDGATPTNVWRVGGLRVTNTSGRHLLDLDAKTLLVSTNGGTILGDLYVQGATARLVANNGTIAVERDLLVDRGTAELTAATLYGTMRDLRVASTVNLSGAGYLDLRGTTIGGGVLDVRDLFVGAYKSCQGYLYMNASTGIDTLWVRRTMIVADSQSSIGQIGWQDPARANDYFLPPGLNLVFGQRDLGASGRGNLRITLNGTGGSSDANGRLAVHSGGTFDGWLSLVDVGRSDAASGSSTARLDLRGLNAFSLDATTLRIGTTASGNSGTPNGIVWLPAGTARVDTVTMGDAVLNNRATLDLTGTVFKIDALLDMRDNTGSNPTELIVRIPGRSCGPDLASGAALSVQGPAKIKLLFEAAPEAGQTPYWGLRWAGSHAAVLGALSVAGNLEMSMNFAGSDAYRTAVYYADGYTYAGLIAAAESVPPAVSARDRTVEVRSAGTTRIDANDLLLALYNPGNLAETGRTIAHPDVNGGTPAAYLDFPTDSLPLTYADVLLTVAYEGSVTATDSADVTFTALAATTTAGLTWIGLADDFVHLDRREWLWGYNWSALQPPANPTTGTLTFGDGDNAATGAKRLAPASDWNGTTPTNVWRIGSLRIGNTTGAHTLDLGGQTLDITGNLQAARLFTTGSLNMTLTNGAVAVGGSLSVANGTVTFTNAQLAVSNDITADAASQIKLGGSTLQGKLRDLKVAGTAEGQAGSVDLRGATIVGGVLDTRDLFVGGFKNNQGYLYIDGTTAITELRARRNVIIGNGQSGIGQIGRLVPALGNDYFLPPNINLVFGERDLAPAGRGSVRIAIANVGGGGSVGRLAVESGGTFDGWLSLLDVGSADTSSGGMGRLDLRGLNAFTLDVSDLKIGTTSGANTGLPNGIAWLPPGTARVDRVSMGHATLNNRATLDLTGTRLIVDERLEMLDNAGANVTELIVHAQGRSCGPDLATGATLTLSGPAKIKLLFEAPPEAGQDHYWGFRWAGNQAAVLGGHEQSGALQLSMSFAESNDYRTAIYFADGFTYAGVIDAEVEVPAEVTARDRTVEVRDAAVTRIDANDVLLAINNPDGLVETGRTITHPSVNSGTPAAFLDFPTDSLPVTYDDVVLTIHFEGDVTAEDTAQVSFIPVPTGSSGDLTWTGLASDFAHLDRREWLWGANWQGLAPPSNPTPAKLTFADSDNTGAAAKRLAPVSDWEGTTPTNRWRIGSLRVGNTAGAHALDLGGQTLEVAGDLQVERLLPTGAAVMTITNGAVEVGGSLAVRQATLSITNQTQARVAVDLAVDSGALNLNGTPLDGVLRDLRVGSYDTGSASLDLRGVAVSGGVLDTRHFYVGAYKGAQGYLHMDETTGIDLLRIRGNVIVGDSEGGIGRIGRQVPARGNEWFLPPGLSLVVGNPDQGFLGRVSFGVGVVNMGGGGGSNGRLAVDSGGTFDGWLSTLDVGRNDISSGGVGVLDLRGLESFTFDASHLRIGTTSVGGVNAAGSVYLPSGDAIVGTLQVCNPAASAGQLQLNDTRLRVLTSMTLHSPAAVTVNVAAARASGLELPGLPTVAAGASVTVVFTAKPAHGDVHYGLKIPGDVTADLQAAAWLTVDATALTGRQPEIFAYRGYTYVGLPRAGGTVLLVK